MRTRRRRSRSGRRSAARSGASSLASPEVSRSTKSGLAPPAPQPASSSVSREPSRRVPPKPYGETGACSVRLSAPWSIAYCMTTPPPIDQPTRWAVGISKASSVACRSSLKSRTPRVASTGRLSVPPKPRRSTAITRSSAGRSSIVSCQKSDDETLPCTNTTVCSGGLAASSPLRSSTLTVRRGVSTRRDVMPSKRVIGGPPWVVVGRHRPTILDYIRALHAASRDFSDGS